MEELKALLPKTQEDYLQTRVLSQIDWFDRKSGLNKKWFLSLKICEIILALFIPFLSGYINKGNDTIQVVVGITGIVVAAIAGLITLVKFQENWVEYRAVGESLKLEKFLYLSNAGPYAKTTAAYPLFVERFESLIAASNQKWVNYSSKKEMEEK